MQNLYFLSAKIASFNLKMPKIFLGGLHSSGPPQGAPPLDHAGGRAPRPPPVWRGLASLAAPPPQDNNQIYGLGWNVINSVYTLLRRVTWIIESSYQVQHSIQS